MSLYHKLDQELTTHKSFFLGDNTSFVLNGVAEVKEWPLFLLLNEERGITLPISDFFFDFRLILFYIVLSANKSIKIFAWNDTSIIGGTRWFDHTSVQHFGFVLMALMIK